MKVSRIIYCMALLAGGAVWSDPVPGRYWPAFPAPTAVVTSVSHNTISYAEGMALATLSGLVAHHTRAEGSGELVWIGLSDAPSYDEWFARWARYQGVPVDDGRYGVWTLIERYRAQGIVKGYILFRRDPATRGLYEGVPADASANVATALCAVLGGVAIEESLESQAKALGLPCLLDARGKDEAWVWAEYSGRFSHDLMALQDPISFVVRDAAVAMNAMVVSGVGPLYETVLGALRPCSPVIGWGIGQEDAITGPSSRYGAFQTATNWCVDLPLLSSGKTGLDYPVKRFPEPEPEARRDDPDTRYVSFIMTDGDNVQWLMLNFCKGGEAQQYWACPDRGKTALGWTVPAMDLLQLCPYTLDYLSETATKNDDFVLLSGGYYYPDWFGDARPEQGLLAQHARRIGTYMRHCGLSNLLVNVQDWDSDAAMKAYATYAQEIAGLDGLFVIQYAPYAAGRGAIRWMPAPDGREVPVMTPRHAIW
ncbi:MAG: hypothetical protein QG656_704, partial [Candidatus Hydrogenedentes bacterium]|nr:hypothetical protein [Candidatus Hydrogenedentota bacterium]